jgi:hypothetical protein
MTGIKDTSCMLTSLPVSNLENLKCLIYVAQKYTIFSNVLDSNVSDDIGL